MFDYLNALPRTCSTIRTFLLRRRYVRASSPRRFDRLRFVRALFSAILIYNPMIGWAVMRLENRDK